MKINTKPVPVIITLAAAFISCVISIVQKVDFSTFVSRLLIVVVIFLVMGTIIKMILDYAFKTLEPAVSIDAELEDTATIEDSDQAIEDISSENLQESE
ncbi:MAG: hypothetical protein K6D38_11335 [Pseudobutyrivibrio sp.]|nr:hypothetical protein [Pseudobutyrivibrio sp.]